MPSLTLPGKVPEIYYHPESNRYYVEDKLSHWIMVTESSVKNRLTFLGYPKSMRKGDELSAADQKIIEIQNSNAIVYAGPLAGYDSGIYMQNGVRILVTQNRKHIESIGTDCTIIRAIIEGMFDSEDVKQSDYYYTWLKVGDGSLNSPFLDPDKKVFLPGPALAVAGSANCCKTLLACITVEALGGRRGLPHRYMIKGNDFNKDLMGSETWVIDDEISSKDIRIRRAFGYMIKNTLFGGVQSGHGKGKDAVTLYPFCRLMILVNDEPESLMILPPVDESLQDKLMLLLAQAFKMPMPANTDDERNALWDVIMDQLTAFMAWLRFVYVIPEHCKFPRTGVKAYKHPVLLEAISALSPEDNLLTLIDDAIFSGNDLEDWTGTANQLTKDLCQSSYSFEAKAVLSWSNACGTYLGRLAKKHPDRFIPIKKDYYRGWRIVAPSQRYPHTSRDLSAEQLKAIYEESAAKNAQK